MGQNSVERFVLYVETYDQCDLTGAEDTVVRQD